MGEMITFTRPDGQSAPAYLAKPAQGDDAPGVVVIQEWWGLNEQIKRVADRLADAGFRALAPDYYRGKVVAPPRADEANHMMTGLDWGQASAEDTRGALQYLEQNGQKAAVLGFCMGGALTLIAAANLEEVKAAVCFYGIPPAEAADPTKIRAPLLCHFATQDDWCNPAAVDALEQKLTSGGVGYELYRYEAQHAFFNEVRPDVHNKEASALAWDRSLAFLKQSLA